MLKIREATELDLQEVLRVEAEAFGEEKGPEIAELVSGLMQDASALPLLSLLAEKDDRAVGHVLFTKVSITNPDSPVSASILAPLAIVPNAQNEGIGGRLIKEGLERLADSGVKLVFVLGHPGYYPRHGFKPATPLGFEAPYPISPKYPDAWMVQELQPGVIDSVSGRVACAEVLDQPQHWRE